MGSDDLDRMAANLDGASRQVSARAGQAMAKSLADIEAGAKNRAPVDTGALRNSISRSPVQRSGSTVRGEVGPTVNYGRYVETGTSRQRAQPYLRPATDAVLPGYEAVLGQLGIDLTGGR